MKNKIILIACYFGKLPNYFQFWQESCFYNKNIDFIFFTDQEVVKKRENFKIINITFESIAKVIKDKIGFIPSKMQPYKLCDFKPAYGKIFEEYIKDYDFFGYCDIDLVFGNIEKYINEEILKYNDVILNLGHLTIYRNIEEYRNLFQKDGGIYDYKIIYSNAENYAFDEMSGMHRIFQKNGIEPYMDIPIADIDKKYSRYRLYDRPNYHKQIFVYDKGIYRYYILKNKIYKEEFLYLHFQKKKINIYVENKGRYIIARGGFFPLNNLENDLAKYNIDYGKGKEFLELIEYVRKKVIQFIKCNISEKKIWIKQKYNFGGIRCKKR